MRIISEVVGTLLFILLFWWFVLLAKPEAQQTDPYNIYENLNNCVFLTGGGGQPVAIAVYRKEHQKEHCN